MAAKPKEKSGDVDIPPGRRTPRSPIPGSPDRNFAEKPVPHYLKPTISSSHDFCKHGKKKASSPDPKTRLPSRSLSEKIPPQKVPASPSPKEKPVKSLSPLMRTPILSKSFSEKLPKVVKNSNVKPPIKAKSHGLARSSSGRREPKPAEISDLTPKTETAAQYEDEEKGIEVEMEQDVGKEATIAFEEQSVPVESPIDSTNTEMNISDQEKLENCNIENSPGSPCSCLEEHEIAAKVEEETETVKNNDEDEIPPVVNDEEKEQSDHSGERGSCEEGNGDQGDGKMGSSKNGEEEGEEGRKLRIRQGSGIGDDKTGEDAGRRMKFRVREEVGVGGGGDEEPPENVVLRVSDVQGKKEAPVFNDVIEETSKKLLESKKSKVKALAGAFETVISLHEGEAQVGNPKDNEGGSNVEENKKG